MSGMAIKFTSLAQIEANQFVLAEEDRPFAREAPDVRCEGPPRPASSDDRFGARVSGIGRLGHGEVGDRNWLWRLARRRRVLSW
jgi:hypothetical protein